jgi:LPS O-antigen subunit length determinant protein (WzzB/FepE family)
MTEKERPSSPQPDHLRSSYSSPEDEISLIDVFEVLVRKKILILTVTLVFTLLAIFYAQSITPVYRATIGFLPSDEIGLASHFPDYVSGFIPGFTKNDLDGKVVKINTMLLQKFFAAFLSYPMQEKVFIENNFIKRFTKDNLDNSEIKKIVLEINNSIRVISNGKDAKALHNETVYLEMVGMEPEIMADFLNVLAEATKNEVSNNTKESIQRGVKNYISNYSAKLEKLRLTARSERTQKISHLSENLAIAKNLGIVKNNFDHLKANSFTIMGHSVPNNFDHLKANSSTIMEHSVPKRMQVPPLWYLYGQPLWYLYGQLALEQELKILKRQPLQYQHTGDAAELNLKLKNLSRVDLSKINLEPIIISQPSITPARPFKPDKIKIIVVGVALGLLIGIIAAFLSNFVGQLRTRPSTT